MDVNESINQINIACRAFGAEKVVLFGSRAKGTALERSDIDVAVAGVSDFDSLEETIEEIPTLYKIDLVNLDTCRNTLLLEDIREYGREI
jgi:predicted nucleotidyltransferase